MNMVPRCGRCNDLDPYGNHECEDIYLTEAAWNDRPALARPSPPSDALIEAVARASEIIANLLGRLNGNTDPTETFIYRSEIYGLREVVAALQPPVKKV